MAKGIQRRLIGRLHQSSMGATAFWSKPGEKGGSTGHITDMAQELSKWIDGCEVIVTVELVKAGKSKRNPWTKRNE